MKKVTSPHVGVAVDFGTRCPVEFRARAHIFAWQFNLSSIILSRRGGNNLYRRFFCRRIRRRRCNFGSRIFLLARKVNRAPSFIWRVPHTWRPRPNVYLFRFREPIITFATGACNDLHPRSPRVFSRGPEPFLSRLSFSRCRFGPTQPDDFVNVVAAPLAYDPEISDTSVWHLSRST